MLKLKLKYIEDLPDENDTRYAKGKEDDIQYRNVYNALCSRPIIGDAVEFLPDGLVYNSQERNLMVHYSGEFSINGIEQSTEYMRYDCDCCKAEREPDVITIRYGNENMDLSLN